MQEVQSSSQRIVSTRQHIAVGGQEVPEILATNIPGVFAAGDVRAGSTKQVASASGEGATAALLIREYLHST